MGLEAGLVVPALDDLLRAADGTDEQEGEDDPVPEKRVDVALS